MCGICGVFTPAGGPPVAKAVLVAMRETLLHRGPDDHGVFAAPGIGLGFRRLSIVDLATGNQPIANEDATLQLVCNGEIFNQAELRKGLEDKGHRFRTHSDVEVILHLYEEHGPDLVSHLNGQFAFALYDRARHRLMLARDPFGVVPLYFAEHDGALIFGSEIKALLAYPGFPRAVDLTGLDQVLSLPGLVSPRTMFHGISSLPPGHALISDRDGLRHYPYWDLDYPETPAPPAPETDGCHREALEACLAAAVRRRLQADVPVGAYLSGGLDSSLITGMMAGMTNTPVRSFSVTFGDRMFDEAEHQALVAAHLGTDHTEIAHPKTDIANGLARAIWHAECPIKESYNTASLALSGAARAAGVPVVLSGEGADELFSGYLGYRYDAFRRMRGGSPPIPCAEAELRRRVWGDETLFYERELAPHEAERALLYAPGVRAGMGDFVFTNWPLVDGGKVKGRHPQHQRSYLDIKLRLGDHLLGDHGDRMLLANAVEGRFPFLDVEVAEMAARLPPDLSLRDFEEKWVLKEIARRHLPPQIAAREKYAFNAPGSAYLLAEGIDWIDEMLSPETIRRQGYFDVARVEALKREARQGEAMPTGGNPVDDLLTVLSFGMFLQLFEMPELGP